MQKQELIVNKTARYFTLGNLDKKTKKIWFVLHGYAQTADSFLASLKALEEENSFVIAPEGLSRFYWKDFTNNPVASWMTKTDRQTDIADNISYLNELYFSVLKDFDLTEVEINYLGFSQGVATLSRWLFYDNIKVNNVFFYAGNLAKELNFEDSQNYNTAKLYYIYGSKDFYIDSTKVKDLESDFLEKKLKMNIFTFVGKHQIDEQALNFINNKLNK